MLKLQYRKPLPKINHRKEEHSMEKKNNRGRPRVAQYIAGDNADFYEKLATNGKKFRSQRSIADSAYALSGAIILREAVSDIDGLELIMNEEYQCRSILNQLGRMRRIEGYSDNAVISIAKEAIKGKKNGYSVKEIEKYIRHGRLTGEW